MTGGICGICSKDWDCLSRLFNMTLDIQDRGQEYCGISTNNGQRIGIRTHHGLVGPSFVNDLVGLEGHLGIGVTHSRERQPMSYYEKNRIWFTVGFDGYLTNADQLRDELTRGGNSFVTPDSVEIVASLIGQEDDIAQGIKQALGKIEGPCSLVLLSKEGIYAARNAMKPLVTGRGKDQKGNIWAVASESCAFGINSGVELIADVEPGKVVLINPDGISVVEEFISPITQICIFEWIYYANPNSIIEGTSVALARQAWGKMLAENDDIPADIVGAVPNSGICYAEGYHLTSGLPSLEIFLPLRDGRRTYIIPTVTERKLTKKRKLVPMIANVQGNKVVVVDDSIRSGITLTDLIELLNNSGSLANHLRIGSPPSIRDCPWAPPPQQEEKFIAADYNLEEIRQRLGADSLRYQDLARVHQAIPTVDKESFCLDCFLRQ